MAFRTGAITAKFDANIKSFRKKLSQANESFEKLRKGVNTNVSKVNKSLSSISKRTEGVRNAIGKITNQIQQMGRAAVHAATGFATAISAIGLAVGGYGLKMGASIQQTAIAFDTMLSSVKKRRKLMQEITDFAKNTPFERFELIDASKQLLAMKINADKIIPTMRMLGDVSAGVSTSVQETAFVFGQIRAQGQAYTQDLNQLATRGIPIYDEVAKVLGVSVATLREGMASGQIKVNFQTIEESFRRMTAEGGQFNNLMEKQSKSLTGIISNVKDSLDTFILRFIGITDEGDVKEGSIFAKAQVGAQKFANWLTANEESISMWGSRVFDAIGNSISVIWSSVISPTLRQFEDWFAIHGTKAIEAFGDYVSSGDFQADIQKAIDVIKDLLEIVQGAIDTFNSAKKAYQDFSRETGKSFKQTTDITKRVVTGGALAPVFDRIRGRENGGDVLPGRLYEVGERNKPEMLTIDDKQYMIPGNKGKVTSYKDMNAQAAKIINVYNYNGAYKDHFTPNSLVLA